MPPAIVETCRQRALVIAGGHRHVVVERIAAKQRRGATGLSGYHLGVS